MQDRRTSHYKTSKKVLKDVYRVMLVATFIACMFPVYKELSKVELHRPLIGVVKAQELPVKVIVAPPKTIEDKIRDMFPEDPDTAVAIAKCESGMRENAFNGKNRNGSWDAGVMQINSVHGYSKEFLFDVDNNLKVARKLYDHSGFNPWVCYWRNK